MSRKKDYRRIKHMLIAIVAVFMLAACSNISGIARPDDKAGVSSGGNVADDVPEAEKTEDVLTAISVSPEAVMLGSGEKMDDSNLLVTAHYESGKTETVTSGYAFRAGTETCVVSEEGFTVTGSAITGDADKVVIEYEGFECSLKVTVYNSLADNMDDDGFVTNPSAYDVVINKERNLSRDYVPEDLVTVSVPTLLANPEVNMMRKDAANALASMFAAAKDEAGYELYARSGYRSYSTQSGTYNSNVAAYGQAIADTFSAKPGQSEHQTGLAMDISCAEVNYLLYDTFGATDEGIWVGENAHRFGFIIRYPKGKDDITGYMYEPWHVRYVGEVLAEKIYESGLTVEEYYAGLEEEYAGR